MFRYTTVQLARWASMIPSFDQVVLLDAWARSCATVGLDDPASRSWLHGDLTQLLTRFRELPGARRVRVNLRAVRTDACRKFHVDFAHMRLITTYLGPGTEWLPQGAARREVR